MKPFLFWTFVDSLSSAPIRTFLDSLVPSVVFLSVRMASSTKQSNYCTQNDSKKVVIIMMCYHIINFHLHLYDARQDHSDPNQLHYLKFDEGVVPIVVYGIVIYIQDSPRLVLMQG